MLNPAVDIRDFLVAEKSGFAGSFFVDFLIRLVANNREVRVSLLVCPKIFSFFFFPTVSCRFYSILFLYSFIGKDYLRLSVLSFILLLSSSTYRMRFRSRKRWSILILLRIRMYVFPHSTKTSVGFYFAGA